MLEISVLFSQIPVLKLKTFTFSHKSFIDDINSFFETWKSLSVCLAMLQSHPINLALSDFEPFDNLSITQLVHH
jgi:hypothetical protein